MALGIRSGFFSRLLRDPGGLTRQHQSLASFGNTAAHWRTLKENIDFQKAFEENVGVSAVLDIKATAKSNVKFKIRDLKTGEFVQMVDMTDEQKAVYNLLKQPNPFQSSAEFWKQFDIFKSTFGNAFWYFSLPDGFTDPIDAYSLINLWPQYTKPIYTGQIFDAQEKSDVVSKYVFDFQRINKEFEVDQVLHRNETSISFTPTQLTLGTSRLRSLQEPISNIDKAFESRNVIIKHRGALGVFSGSTKDATGTQPLAKTAKKEVQEDFKDYGTLKNQWQYIFTRFPLVFQRTALPIKDLQLFEEVAIDIVHISNKFGVPPELSKAYLEGATYENQEQSMRRLYQDTVVPETNDDVKALNTYFKTEERGFEIVASFDHVAVLQKNRKEDSEVNKNQGDIYEKLFFAGNCTYNEWREASGAKPNDKFGDKTIFELTPEQRDIILGTTKTESNA